MTRTQREATLSLLGPMQGGGLSQGESRHGPNAWPRPAGGEPGPGQGLGPAPSQDSQAMSASQQKPCAGSGAPGHLRKPQIQPAIQLQGCTRPFSSHLQAWGWDGGKGKPQTNLLWPPAPPTCPQLRGTVPTDAGTGRDSTHGCSETDRPPHACRSCACSTTAVPLKRQPSPPGTRPSHQPHAVCQMQGSPRETPGMVLCHGDPW